MREAMRKSDRQLSEEAAWDILNKGEYGILSVITKNNEPYGIPLNYVLDGKKLLFHCAKEGKKLDAILKNPDVCFTVVGSSEVVPDKYTTKYDSAIVFGKASVVEDLEELRRMMTVLCDKYSKGLEEKTAKVIERTIDRFLFVSIDIEYITGKKN